MRCASHRKFALVSLALTLTGVGLASCGRFERAQRAAWRDQAEAQCLTSRQVAASSYVSFRSTAIEGPGTCGMQQPLRVNALSRGNVKLSSAATLACPIVPTTDRWLDKVVQKAASERLGSPVVEIRAGSYSCRAMNNGSGTRRTSEHAYGNALDIFGFRLADGREVTVRGGWNGRPEERAFLREVFLGACDMFSTVLGPGADMFHYDHFHVDLARHGKGRQICKPRITAPEAPDFAPPQPDRGVMASAQQMAPAPAQAYAGQSYPIPDAARRAVAAGPLSPIPDRSLPPGWTQGPQGRPLDEGPRVASVQQPAGAPLMLPGASYLRDEVIIGDIEGQGVIDRPGSDVFGADPAQGGYITPENDPFAVRR
jgi:hypothetical protein